MISKLFLLSGSDLRLTAAAIVKHPTVTDILAINNGYWCEEYYWAYISAILSDPYDYMVYLDDKKIDYETVTPFFVFSLRWADLHMNKDKTNDDAAFLEEALTFFFGPHKFRIIPFQGKSFLIDEEDPTWIIDDNLFNLVCDFLIQINCIERTDKIRPASPGAKKILIDDMRREQKRKAKDKKAQKPISHIGDALATVLAGGAGAITPANYANTHIYQLLASSHSIQKQMVVQAMLNGIYTGMLKADKISNDELSWV